MSAYNHRWVNPLKRSFDILVACLGLLLSLPLWPLITLAIKLTSPGPVVYRQQRIGLADSRQMRVFWMYKFRSMRCDAEATTGAVWASAGDPRVTRVGRFLRNTRLDEIPQLFNVLRGDMSIVGPRPERPQLYGQLEQNIPFYAERTYGLRPGITGLAQVNQGYDTCLEDVRRKVGFDHAYALLLSRPLSWLKTDLSIILQTFWLMVRGRGQ
ncbi:sugar transferase [Bowmanella sp. JS7-9]|uniref:Sugar transferase n=1 Tax=Pseudobowmanella zhangzhouensis TaxID=1537679 RepID=A0ABW1XIV0_9ALTE|nr:sugar transferase [Bowmanella sp. JS7-9]TBX24681.1 sugar transferase [Bowmanella sp. JS7-9]